MATGFANAVLIGTPVGDALRVLTHRRFPTFPDEKLSLREVPGGPEAAKAEKRAQGGEAQDAPLSPPSAPGVNGTGRASSRASSPTLCRENGFTIIDWEASDPELPENWSLAKKLWVSFCIAYASFAVYLGGGITTTSYQSLMDDFGVTHQEATLTMSMYIFAYGAGALIFSPLSEIYQLGRNPSYYIGMVVVVAMQIGAATTPSFAGFVILRLLVGFFGSPLLTVGGSTLADIWGVRKLPPAMCLTWILPAFCAPGLAPIVTVYAVLRFGWRWSMWIHLIALSLGLVCMLLCPETFPDHLLHRRADRMRRRTGDTTIKTRAEINGEGKEMKDLIYEALAVPFKVTLLDPSILFANVYIGVCYAVFFSFFDAFPFVYGDVYGFSAAEQSLTFLCAVVGGFIGATIYTSYQLFVMFPEIAKNGQPVFERRLELALGSSVTGSAGLWIFAWSGWPQTHWMGPAVGSTLFVASNMITFQSVFLYISLAYPRYAASVMAANDFIRSCMAAGMVHVATPLFGSSAGIHGGVSMLAGIAACGIVGIWILYLYGAKLRAKSRFTGDTGAESSGSQSPVGQASTPHGKTGNPV